MSLPQAVPSKRSDPSVFSALWAPGVRFMGNLRFGRKAMVICLMFLAPLAWLTWSDFSSKRTNLAFSSKEILGVAYNREIIPVINLAQQLRRDASAAAASGSTPPTLVEVQSQLLAAQERLAAVDARLGGELGAAKAYAEVQTAFAATGKVAGFDAVFQAHTAHINALVALLTAVNDASNLTLDPDIDSYYLMDSVFFRIPDIVESSGKLRGLGLGIMKTGSATPEQMRVLNSIVPIADFQFGNMRDGLAKAIASNPALASQVNAAQALSATADFFAMARKSVIEGRDYSPPTQAAYLALANQALSGQYALADRMLDALDALLQQRVAGFRYELQKGIAVLLIGLLLAGYFFYSFFLVTSRGLNTVKQHLTELADGDLSQAPAAPTSSDEIAQVLTSLITVHDVLGRFQSAQSEMARQHDAGHISHSMPAGNLPGTYGDLAQGVNAMVKAHIDLNARAVDLMDQYANGRFDESMQALPGQKRRITEVVNAAKAQMEQAATAATFNQRIRLSLDSLPVCVTVSNAEALLVHATPPAKALL